MNKRISEILAGLVVIVAASVFLAYAASRTRSVGGAGYDLTARFGSIGPLAVGAPVKIAGVTIGEVTRTALDPQTYAAIVRFRIQPDIKIPKDSSAAIESASLLGGDYLSISPGGSETMLVSGQAITATQSAINIESLLGKFVFSAANFASSASKAQGGAANSGGGK
ncbi:MAG: outer membrane lipid asymmetry maintenance protein MlaD [Acidiphilium sp. 37-67-22]|nr:MAG: outer membrane lipid asymmetry maintenance protein MlaD [Acidiphilium sp. 37-67-22]HQT74639.1 outer membrane lipid asymmetry maintenance protein MlaD [Acidiphilium sp.]